MKIQTTHPGGQGRTLVQMVEDELDAAIQKYEEGGQDNDVWFAEGIAHALGVFRSTDSDTELDRAHERLAKN